MIHTSLGERRLSNGVSSAVAKGGRRSIVAPLPHPPR